MNYRKIIEYVKYKVCVYSHFKEVYTPVLDKGGSYV